MSESVVIDTQLNSSIGSVWNAITDPATLSTWMMFKENTFRPEVGHAFQFKGAPGYDGVIDCEVTEVDEPHRLSYTWSTIGQDNEPHSTVVTFALTAAGDDVTNLRFEQSGFRTGAGQEIGGATYSWQYMLDELQKVLG